jgi:uncharacterized repeat protein (TIGR01451 family)
MTVSTGRWDIAIVAAAVLLATGLATAEPTISLLGIVPLFVYGYGMVSSPPAGSVAVERDLSTHQPKPNAEIRIRVTVKNLGNDALPSIRVEDGVPDALQVISGSPVWVSALGPSDSATFEYTVRAQRGLYEFERAEVVFSSFARSKSRSERCGTGDSVSCRTIVDDMVIRRQTLRHGGAVSTNSGGEGVEFFSARQYQRGDPLSRVDWNRYAASRELSTIQYRNQRASHVVLLIDNSESAGVARSNGDITGLDLCLAAADEMLERLAKQGSRTDVAFLVSPELTAPRGSEQRAPGCSFDEYLLRSVTRKDTADISLDALGRRIPSTAQTIVLTPLLSDAAVEIVQYLKSGGHQTTVFSPDITEQDGDSTVGRRLEGIERSARIATIQAGGIPVESWHPQQERLTGFANALSGGTQ